jgi:DNA-binding CsgD family transcriptional regulator/PAS domain-containing protein
LLVKRVQRWPRGLPRRQVKLRGTSSPAVTPKGSDDRMSEQASTQDFRAPETGAADRLAVIAVGADLIVRKAFGELAELYPGVAPVRLGQDLRHFIEDRANRGFLGINEILKIKEMTPLETRLLELESYPAYQTYQIAPSGSVLLVSHSKTQDDVIVITIVETRLQLGIDATDRFERGAKMLQFESKVSNLSGFGLVEHIAYSIINAMTIPLVVINSEGIVLASNESAQNVFRFGRIKVTDRDQLELPDGKLEAVLSHLRATENSDIVTLDQYLDQGLRFARIINTPPLGKIYVLALDDSGDQVHQLEQMAKVFPNLSAAEREVAILLLSGMVPKRIAASRNASIHTVRTQVASILRKTNCDSVYQLMVRSRLLMLI